MMFGRLAFVISLATRILQQLAGEVQERKTQRHDPDAPLFGENEVLIFVGMALIWQTVIVYGAVKLSETMKSARFNRIMDVVCAIAFAAISVLIFAEL